MSSSRRRLTASTMAVMVFVVASACGGSGQLPDFSLPPDLFPTGDGTETLPPDDEEPFEEDTPPPNLGSWEGTATFNADVDIFDESTENSTFADEPASITNRYEYTSQITDEYEITGMDVQYPILYDAEFEGTVANEGSADKKDTTIDEHTLLAGCRFEEVREDRTTGSWSLDSYNSGGIKFEPRRQLRDRHQGQRRAWHRCAAPAAVAPGDDHHDRHRHPAIRHLREPRVRRGGRGAALLHLRVRYPRPGHLRT